MTPTRHTARRRWLLVMLPPLCFLLKDVIATVALLPLEVNSERADLYHFVAFLPGTIYVHGSRAILFNVLVGAVLGLFLPSLLTHAKSHIGLSLGRGAAGGVAGGALLLLIYTIAAGGIAAWQWWLVSIVFHSIQFAIVGAVVAIGILVIESGSAREVGGVLRVFVGTSIGALIRIYSPLALCKPYYVPCTFSGVLSDLLFYGITVGAIAGLFAGLQTSHKSIS